MDIDAPATDIQSAQDITTRVEDALYGADEPQNEDPTEPEEEVVSEDEETLPEDDDTETEDEEGSEDLEEMSLADYLGVDDDRITVDENGGVMFNALIDGESKSVPLTDLVKSYQLQGHVNNKSVAIENERKAFEEQRNTAASELKTRLDGVNALVKLSEQQLLGEYNGIDWDKLRAENPSEWTALRQEFAERAQKIQKTMLLAGEEQQRLAQEEQQKAQEQHSVHMQEQYAKMVENNPDWVDEAKRTSALSEIRSGLTKHYGFEESDMQYVTDHRLVSLIQDALAYRNGKTGAQKKAVKKVPKFQKPGSMKSDVQRTAKARSVKAKKDAVRKGGGHVKDVANLLVDRM